MSAKANFRRIMSFPDFIIAGAPKAGTTTLHNLLHQHKDIEIQIKELHFFDADDPLSHYEFFQTKNGSLQWKDPDSPNARQWYAAQFADMGQGSLKGEDSTNYLHSFIAARRIKRTLPSVKLIFALRDPIERTISHYWHLVRTGRTSLSLEHALIAYPRILRASAYEESIRNYLALFPRDQVAFFILEKFRDDPVSVTRDITDFLGVEPFEQVPMVHANRSSYPKFPTFFRQINRVRQKMSSGRWHWHMSNPGHANFVKDWRQDRKRRFIRQNLYLNLLTDAGPPAINPSVACFLFNHLSERNAGLYEILGDEISKLWPTLSNKCDRKSSY